jgi:hypothetical protein
MISGVRTSARTWSMMAASIFDSKRLLASRLVHTLGEEFLFAHALIHEAVYDSLLKSHRRELHRRAAEWFAHRDATLKASHLERVRRPLL